MGEVLDIGCGRNKRPGAFGIDISGDSAADLVHDLGVFPWPLGSDRFDEIHADNVLEHLTNVVATLEEIHRVAKKGARVFIATPHFASLSSWEDPTHLHHFARESFDYFCEGTTHTSHYSRIRFRRVSSRLSFPGSPGGLLGRFLCAVSPRRYEKRWCFVFRPGTVRVELEVLK